MNETTAQQTSNRDLSTGHPAQMVVIPQGPHAASDTDERIAALPTWAPTTDGLAAYRAREVELCKLAMQYGAASAQHFTLFSQRTWDEALRQLGGMPRVDPKDVARIEAIRKRAAEAASVTQSPFPRRNGEGGVARRSP